MKNEKVKNIFKTLFKKGDLLLVFILILAVALTVYLSHTNNANDVCIYINGSLKYTYSINSDITVDLSNDGIDMQIVISNGKVYVAHSDCKEQLCVHQTPITKDGGSIVCLPNRVVIRVENRDIDAIS